MLTDAQSYSVHRNMQIHDTELFLDSVVQKMDWTRHEQDVVMDIGCGPGNSCKEMILPFLPKLKKLIAFDVVPDMIKFAKQNNASDKIEYHIADIEKKSTLEKWVQQISKVISIYCFHWLDNQKEAFKNIYQLLKPGGEAALLFVLTSHYWDSYEELTGNPKWKKHLENANPRVPMSYFKKYDASYYRSFLQDMGFNVIICEEEKRIYTYPSDENCRSAVYSLCALASYIPDDLKSEFKEELFQGFVKYNGRNPDGRPVLLSTTLSLFIQKPNV